MKFKKYLGLILIVGLLYLGLYFLNAKESFSATICTQFTNCSDCINGKVIDSSSPCYWSSEKNKCGSFDDPSYSRSCNPAPAPTPTPNGDSCLFCKECPELTLIKNP
jgi:hypothetical protein